MGLKDGIKDDPIFCSNDWKTGTAINLDKSRGGEDWG